MRERVRSSASDTPLNIKGTQSSEGSGRSRRTRRVAKYRGGSAARIFCAAGTAAQKAAFFVFLRAFFVCFVTNVFLCVFYLLRAGFEGHAKKAGAAEVIDVEP